MEFHHLLFFLLGSGVVAVHYYTVYLKKRLGRDGYARYESNPYIHWTGVVLTFTYSCVTLFFFANPLDKAARIVGVLK